MLALALLLLGGGGFALYAGVTGQQITPALRDVLGGRKPTGAPAGGAGSSGSASSLPPASASDFRRAESSTSGGPIGARVAALIDAAPGEITVTSGTRTRAQQEKLWKAALAKYGSPEAARKWVAPPGSSKHETGEANDLRFSSQAVKQWAHANAARFGLVFPLSNEPWHVELIGARSGGSSRPLPVSRPVA